MKARPRSVERRVAEMLNEHFKAFAVRPVERIPVLGRTGPDISLNEWGLVIDVKSRREIPRTIFFPLITPFTFDGLLAVRLCNLPALWDEQLTPGILDFSSKTIRAYIQHMDAWTAEFAPGGVTCVVLHRPEMPIGSSVAIIYSHRRRRLIEYANRDRITDPRE